MNISQVSEPNNPLQNRETELVWKLYGGVLSLYELDGLSEAVKEGDHGVVESPVVEDSSEMKVA